MITTTMSCFNASIPFRCIALDTCANYRNTVGSDVFVSMKVIWPKLEKSDIHEPITLNGMGGQTASIGCFKFTFVFGGRSYSMDVYVMLGRTPLVMCHATMNVLGLSYHSLEGRLIRVADGFSRPVKMVNGLPFLTIEDGFETILSEAELRKVHRNLGHPSVSTAMRTIESSRLSHLPNQDRKVLQRITDNCRICQLVAQKPKRFKISLHDDSTGEL
jgi:hypothetical protein